ncbi:hypothetical protein Bpfe_015402, partial [Biomphalaria pfeifferi]
MSLYYYYFIFLHHVSPVWLATITSARPTNYFKDILLGSRRENEILTREFARGFSRKPAGVYASLS